MKIRCILWLMLPLLLFSCGKGTQVNMAQIEDGFRNIPDSVQTAVYWYWIDNYISKEGVVKDLEAMKRVGINRAFIGNQGISDDPDGPVRLFSDEWWDITHTAMKTAGELGIEIGMFNCPGWSQSGGPWIKPEQSMKYVAFASGEHPDIPQDRIIARLAYPTVEGFTQSWTLKPGAAKAVLRPDKAFTARSLWMTAAGAFDTGVRLLADGREVASFYFDRHNTALNVGFQPLAPVVITLPEVQAGTYEIVLEEPAAKPLTVTLSEVPAVEKYAEKSLAKVFQDPLPMWDHYMWDTPAEPTDGSFCVQPGQVIQLDGEEAPEGWTVLTAYMESTGVTNSPAVPEGTGLEVDKINKQYIASHFDAFVGELLRRIPAQDRKTWKVVVEDSYETGSQNWTDDMADVFRQTYGYDPIPYLPVLQGTVVGSVDRSDRFLWDLRRLVADRVAYDYVAGLREESNRHGLETWLECYGHWGFPGEFLLYGSQSDQIAGEFWSEGSLGDIENRAASSCGHIYGKNKVWAESCTAGGPQFHRSPRMMKQRVDRFFCEGINATLLHLYIQQPDDSEPGRSAWFGNEFNRNNSWFEGMGTFVEYLKRCNFMLQQGRYVADVAYFIGEDAPKMTGVCDPELPKGYSFDYINADVLKNHARVKDGKLLLDSGMEYRVLVLPKQETMRPEVLECIDAFVRQGLAVLGPLPKRSPSLQGYPEADAHVLELAEQLRPHVIADGVRLETVLENLNLAPDFRYEGEGNLLFIHRTLGKTGEIYFVSNQEEKTVEVCPVFRVPAGLQPQLWDPLTGETRAWDGKNLSLEPLQSVFVVFSKEVLPERAYEGGHIALEGPWTVEFAASAGKPAFSRTFEQLEDWSRSEEPEVRFYSGHATYTKRFSLPAVNGAVLDLGEVMVLAQVRINGQAAGGVWTWPYRLDISRFVQEGENTLEVTVYNNWQNRLIADEKLRPEERGTWTNHHSFEADDPLQSSGLLGPVQIITTKD